MSNIQLHKLLLVLIEIGFEYSYDDMIVHNCK